MSEGEFALLGLRAEVAWGSVAFICGDDMGRARVY